MGFAEAALLHVEDLFGADLADAGFVLGGVLVAAHGDGGVGIRAAVGVDEEGIALGIIFSLFLQVLKIT